MHESALLMKIIQTVQTAASKNQVRHIKAIELDIGELSGVLPIFLKQYFTPFTKDDELFHQAELIIHSVPGTGLCQSCQQTFHLTGWDAACPHCGSRQILLLSGREITIRNILVETDNRKDKHDA